MNAFFQRISTFLTTAEPLDLVILAALIIIPILAIIVLIVAMANGAKRRNADKELSEDTLLPAETEIAAPMQTSATGERVIVYVPQTPAQAKTPVKVNIKKLKKADKSLLAATAIFCFGLGVMLQRAMSGDK